MKSIPVLVIILAVVIVVGLLVASSVSDNVAQAAQAQAAIEASRAAQVAAAGQAFTASVLSVLLVIETLVLIGLVILVLRIRSVKTGNGEQGQWIGGPNANFQRVGGGQERPKLNAGMLEQLVMMRVLNLLTDMEKKDPPRSTAQLLDQNGDSEEIDWR